jgi:RecG-like helicase
MHPSDPVMKHFRLTPPQISALKRLGVVTIEQLIRHFPTRYERAGASVRVAELTSGSKVTLFGTVTGLKAGVPRQGFCLRALP